MILASRSNAACEQDRTRGEAQNPDRNARFKPRVQDAIYLSHSARTQPRNNLVGVRVLYRAPVTPPMGIMVVRATGVVTSGAFSRLLLSCRRRLHPDWLEVLRHNYFSPGRCLLNLRYEGLKSLDGGLLRNLVSNIEAIPVSRQNKAGVA